MTAMVIPRIFSKSDGQQDVMPDWRLIVEQLNGYGPVSLTKMESGVPSIFRGVMISCGGETFISPIPFDEFERMLHSLGNRPMLPNPVDIASIVGGRRG